MALLYMATEHFCAQCHLCLSPFNDICNEEGRIELFTPNREEGLDGFVHQQHERHKGFHPSEPGKSSMKISEMASGDRHVTAGQA